MYNCEGIGLEIAHVLRIPFTVDYFTYVSRKEELSHNSLNYEELESLFRLNLWMPKDAWIDPNDQLWNEVGLNDSLFE